MDEHFGRDIERVQSLDVVPAILELICRTTGMGFAAIARVTEERWITCAVKDDIAFGLKPGDELEIKTTLCNEVRAHSQPIVIDEVSTDEDYVNHHTPAMYGFQSYISVPLYLKSGTFFGTLCAIDPHPFPLKKNGTLKMFELFCDLISFHLELKEQMEIKAELLKQTEGQLSNSKWEVDQYAHINKIVLQEPLRKLQVFADMLIADGTLPQGHASKQLALEVNMMAKGISAMVSELGTFSSIPAGADNPLAVDLNRILKDTLIVLRSKMNSQKGAISLNPLPVVNGVASQLGRVFINLLDNALTFTLPGVPPVIYIRVKDAGIDELQQAGLDTNKEYHAIDIQDNGIGIQQEDMPYIFNLFTRLNNSNNNSGVGMGLAQARKIMNNHGGTISVASQPGHGSTFTLLFPKG